MGAAADALAEMQERASGDPDAAAAAGMDEALHAERIRVWKLQADAWLDEQPQGALFTADDLIAAIGKPDVGQGRNNAVGAWINAQRNRRRIEFTGRISKSRRVEGHGNMQRLWRVKDGRFEGDVGCTTAAAARRRLLEPARPVLDEAPAPGPRPSAGVSSSTGLLPPLTVEEEEEAVLLLREEGVDLGEGEQLGLLGTSGPTPGAYSGAA